MPTGPLALTRRALLALAATPIVSACFGRQEAAAPSATAARSTAAASPTASASTAASQVAVPSCVVRPELTEGPYFVDEKLDRSDIRVDPSDGTTKDGAVLRLTMRVAQVSGSSCTALAGAIVDLWHCDALGIYSDVSDPGFNTKGKKFLRGYQTTDANGRVQFVTVYPGWYQGRAVHVHFKIRSSAAAGARSFTSQLFFDDALTDRVHAQAPYASKGQGRLRNSGDDIFRSSNDKLTLAVTQDGSGYASTFDIRVQLA